MNGPLVIICRGPFPELDGQYLVSSDVDANAGRGATVWSPDLADAKQFDTFIDAMQCWTEQSTVQPYRDDGQPNKPLTAYSIEPMEVSKL